MTAALLDVAVRPDPAPSRSSHGSHSRSGGTFDDAISDAVTKAKRGPRHARHDDEVGTDDEAAAAGLADVRVSTPATVAVDHRVHDATPSHRAIGIDGRPRDRSSSRPDTLPSVAAEPAQLRAHHRAVPDRGHVPAPPPVDAAGPGEIAPRDHAPAITDSRRPLHRSDTVPAPPRPDATPATAGSPPATATAAIHTPRPHPDTGVIPASSKAASDTPAPTPSTESAALREMSPLPSAPRHQAPVDLPVTAAQIPTATASLTNSTPAATAAPAASPAPALALAQPDIASILGQLRGRADGTYQLRAQVHPAELGAVNITATVSGGALSVVLGADAHAHHVLSQVMPQLRDYLADQGFTGVDVGLGSPDQDAGHTGDQPGEHHTQGSDHQVGAADTEGPVARRIMRHTGAIDRML